MNLIFIFAGASLAGVFVLGAIYWRRPHPWLAFALESFERATGPSIEEARFPQLAAEPSHHDSVRSHAA